MLDVLFREKPDSKVGEEKWAVEEKLLEEKEAGLVE